MIGCIIQARMGSTRLPGKAMKKINGKTQMLKFQLNQLKFSKCIEKVPTMIVQNTPKPLIGEETFN